MSGLVISSGLEGGMGALGGSDLFGVLMALEDEVGEIVCRKLSKRVTECGLCYLDTLRTVEDLGRVCQLLQSGPSVAVQLLLSACGCEPRELVYPYSLALLLRASAPFGRSTIHTWLASSSHDGQEMLSFVAGILEPSEVRLLLSQRDHYGQSAFHAASERGQIDVLRLCSFFFSPAELTDLATSRDNKGQSPLLLAALRQHWTALEVLLTLVDHSSFQMAFFDGHGNSVLRSAASGGPLHVFESLSAVIDPLEALISLKVTFPPLLSPFGEFSLSLSLTARDKQRIEGGGLPSHRSNASKSQSVSGLQIGRAHV